MAPTVMKKRRLSVVETKKVVEVGTSRVKIKTAEGNQRRSADKGGSEASAPPGPTLTPEEILRRHFESQFAPLEGSGRSKRSHKHVSDDEDEDDEEEADEDDDDTELSYDSDSGSEGDEDDEDKYDDFSDVSEQDAANILAQVKDSSPEVVDYTGTRFTPTAILSKAPKSELKAFMSHKVPALIPTTAAALAPNPIVPKKRSKPTTGSDADDDDDASAANLKNDLALQRLLRESHLLDPLSSTASTGDGTISLNPTGKNRHRAINTRVQSLGGVDITKHKMPVPMKYGMTLAKDAREKKRVRVARDSGIVLEKKTLGEEERRKREKDERKRRENRGFGPAVGKFKNGALVLSKKDVRDIEGPRERSGGKGKRGGKGKKR